MKRFEEDNELWDKVEELYPITDKVSPLHDDIILNEYIMPQLNERFEKAKYANNIYINKERSPAYCVTLYNSYMEFFTRDDWSGIGFKSTRIYYKYCVGIKLEDIAFAYTVPYCKYKRYSDKYINNYNEIIKHIISKGFSLTLVGDFIDLSFSTKDKLKSIWIDGYKLRRFDKTEYDIENDDLTTIFSSIDNYAEQ